MSLQVFVLTDDSSPGLVGNCSCVAKHKDVCAFGSSDGARGIAKAPRLNATKARARLIELRTDHQLDSACLNLTGFQ